MREQLYALLVQGMRAGSVRYISGTTVVTVGPHRILFDDRTHNIEGYVLIGAPGSAPPVEPLAEPLAKGHDVVYPALPPQSYDGTGNSGTL